jgi:hypothetical protein
MTRGEALFSRVGFLARSPGFLRPSACMSAWSEIVVRGSWSHSGGGRPRDFPVGAHESQLRLSGSHDPSLGAIGGQLDRLLLHQLAEATVRALPSQLVAALLLEPQSLPRFAAPSVKSEVKSDRGRGTPSR